MSGTKAHKHAGFTLIEIMIVIALIVLIIALAMPAFSFITGSRSVDAGENLVSSMLGLARAKAIANDGTKSALMFFRDPTNERTAMALIVLPADPGLYKSWRQLKEDGTATTYAVGNEVYRLVDSGPAGKQINKKFRCILDHTSAASTAPPAQPTAAGTSNTWWSPVNENIFEVGQGFEVQQIQYLPSGVSAQLINDPDPDPTNAAPAAGRDRYVRVGLIIFDSGGALLHQQYRIYETAQPYQLAGLPITGAAGAGFGTAAGNPVFSQLGVVLYEEQGFRGTGGDDVDPVNANLGYTSGTPGGREGVEEAWLDNNSLSLMINRYNGTLVRGE